MNKNLLGAVIAIPLIVIGAPLFVIGILSGLLFRNLKAGFSQGLEFPSTVSRMLIRRKK